MKFVFSEPNVQSSNKNGKKTIPAKIYEYGAGSPDKPDVIIQILASSRDFYNELVRLYKDKVQKRHAIALKSYPRLVVLNDELVVHYKELERLEAAESGGTIKNDDGSEEKIDGIKSSINALKFRTKNKRDPEYMNKISALEKERKELKKQIKEKKAFIKVIKDERDDLNKKKKELCEPAYEYLHAEKQRMMDAHYGSEKKRSKIIAKEYEREILAKMVKDTKYPIYWRNIMKLEAKYEADMKKLIDEVDLHWTTRNLVLEQFQQAAKRVTSAKHLKIKKGPLEGRVGGQIQGGMDVNSLFVANQKALDSHDKALPAMIDVPSSDYNSKGKRKSRKEGRTFIKIMVGRDNQSHVTFPVIMHRRLPEGSIRYFWVNCFHENGRPKFKLNLTIQGENLRAVPNGTGAVSFIPSFKSHGRAHQYSVGQYSNGEHLLVSHQAVLGLQVTGSLKIPRSQDDKNWRSGKDRCFNEAKQVMQDYLSNKRNNQHMTKLLTKKLHSYPDKTSKERADDYIKYLPQLRKTGKFWFWASIFVESTVTESKISELWKQWKEERFNSCPLGHKLFGEKSGRKDLFSPEDGESENSKQLIFDWLKTQGITNEREKTAIYLEWWRRKDLHMDDMISNLRVKSLRHRKNDYAVEAYRLAQRYDTFILPKHDLANMAKTYDTDINGNDLSRVAQKEIALYRRAAAFSEFKLALKNAFGENLIEVKCPEKDEIWTNMSSSQQNAAIMEAYREYKNSGQESIDLETAELAAE